MSGFNVAGWSSPPAALVLLLSTLALGAGCAQSDDETAADSGASRDGGATGDAGSDGGASDAGSQSTDAGSPLVDAGPPPVDGGMSIPCNRNNQCDDGDLCTEDACDRGAGYCTFTPVDCEDGDACTSDSCNPTNGQCEYIQTVCDDGNPCTGDSGDPSLGSCTYTALADGAPCSGGACQVGVCVPTTPPPTCTVHYDLDAVVEVTGSPAGTFDHVKGNNDGRLVIAYSHDGAGNIVEGPVRVLHYGVFVEHDRNHLGVDYQDRVHQYGPACNGETSPTWRIDTDPGFPALCDHDGVDRGAVATGWLDAANDRIIWNPCQVAADYWDLSVGDYDFADVSAGPGCLADVRQLGYLYCDPGWMDACTSVGLSIYYTVVDETYTQPLITNQACGQDATLSVTGASRDSLTTPSGAFNGADSYNMPNRFQNLEWLRFTGTRIEPGPGSYTTCN